MEIDEDMFPNLSRDFTGGMNPMGMGGGGMKAGQMPG